MGFSIYNDKLLDHALHPRNVGEMEDADGVAMVGDPLCGDLLKVWIRVDGDCIADIKFKCKGCPAAIAIASAMTEMALGKNLDEASAITDDDIEAILDGLPEQKRHCSNLGATALYEAIMDYTHKCIARCQKVDR
jgi:nitrogen fixation NifU-like protein